MANKIVQLKDGTDNLYTNEFFRTYTITRTENAYVNATNVARISLYRVGNVGFLYFNFAPSTSIPAGTASFEIGRFNCTLKNTFMQSVPGQSVSSATIALSISSAGVLSVGNYSGTATGTSFFRTLLPVVFTDPSA